MASQNQETNGGECGAGGLSASSPPAQRYGLIGAARFLLPDCVRVPRPRLARSTRFLSSRSSRVWSPVSAPGVTVSLDQFSLHPLLYFNRVFLQFSRLRWSGSDMGWTVRFCSDDLGPAHSGSPSRRTDRTFRSETHADPAARYTVWLNSAGNDWRVESQDSRQACDGEAVRRSGALSGHMRGVGCGCPKLVASVWSLQQTGQQEIPGGGAVMGEINKVVPVTFVRGGGAPPSACRMPAAADSTPSSMRLGRVFTRPHEHGLFINCRLADSSQGLPPLIALPQGPRWWKSDTDRRPSGQRCKAGALTDCRSGETPHSALQVSYSHPGDSLTLDQVITKALIGQLIIFNQILGELRQDIREQVKEMALIRNTILECQVCGFLSLVPAVQAPVTRCVLYGESAAPGHLWTLSPGTTDSRTYCRDIGQVWTRARRHGNTTQADQLSSLSSGLWGRLWLDRTGLHGNLKQECVDIDECVDLPGACVSNSVCINTVGSYKCGGCKPGFLGNRR
ncbi:thrombospondin-3a [Lates japonicus]|uniref:Thrombospondin-3a n=1 Tax=Lates japonicus TaxID=270547 RepID=A0AAD3NA90_LATJO|nr:thrombospondin-3a [Lates japonicus]